ncbi:MULTISPECIES: DUF4351 domain-containing protein [Aerosakkonema]|uniref:DUF4351 domain-containing protein n=1 Tax=Aerosakkonema TaxID=1246629 RepID=UPI0035B6CA91
MEDSLLYQEIMQKGVQEGWEQGLQLGLQQGLEQGWQHGQKYQAFTQTRRQLRRRIGAIGLTTEERIRALSLSQLEALGEALLDFSAPADLTAWLDNLASKDPV